VDELLSDLAPIMDEQRHLRQAVRAFATGEVTPLAAESDNAECFSRGLLDRMAAKVFQLVEGANEIHRVLIADRLFASVPVPA